MAKTLDWLLVCFCVTRLAVANAKRFQTDQKLQLHADAHFCNVFELPTVYGVEDGEKITQYGVKFAFKTANKCSNMKCGYTQLSEMWDEVISHQSDEMQCSCYTKTSDGESGKFFFKSRVRNKNDCSASWCWTEYSRARWMIMHKLRPKDSIGDNDVRTANHFCGGMASNQCHCASTGSTEMSVIPSLQEVVANKEGLTEQQKKDLQAVKKELCRGGICFDEEDVVVEERVHQNTSFNAEEEEQEKEEEKEEENEEEKEEEKEEESINIAGTYIYKGVFPSKRSMYVTQHGGSNSISIGYPADDNSPSKDGTVSGSEVTNIEGGPISIDKDSGDLKFASEQGVWVKVADNDCKDLAAQWRAYGARTKFAQEGLESSEDGDCEAAKVGLKPPISTEATLGIKSCQATLSLKKALADRERDETTLTEERNKLKASVAAAEEKYTISRKDAGSRICSYQEKPGHFQWGVSLAVPMKKKCSSINCQVFNFKANMQDAMKSELKKETGKCECKYLGSQSFTFTPKMTKCSSEGCWVRYTDIRAGLQRTDQTSCTKDEKGKCVKPRNEEFLPFPDHWTAECNPDAVSSLPISKEFLYLLSKEEGKKEGNAVKDDVGPEVEEVEEVRDYGESAGDEQGISGQIVDAVAEDQENCPEVEAKLEAAKAEFDQEGAARNQMRVKLQRLKGAIEGEGLKKEIRDLKKQNAKLEAAMAAIGL